jgi:hypothetical protein
MTSPIFTCHSALRRMERGIEQKHIMDALTYGRVIESDGVKDVYALDRLRVVVAREGRVIITAWREEKDNAKRRIRRAKKERNKRKRRWG